MSRHEPAQWVNDGMHVWIPWNRERNAPGDSPDGTALRCTVACAAGDHARIVNDRFGVDQWRRVASLYVPPKEKA